MAVEPKDLFNLVEDDVRELVEAEKSYGDSWRKRGGVGAFMMLARKWDRIENQCIKDGYDIFDTISKDPTDTGILDDIRDLRRYLILVENFMTKIHTIEKREDNYEESRD
jgi:hypothetical protein|tara:strand:- start:1023 stop:1352 length:330 start_codon:yes stop_codon:yes gene_type:complete